MSKTTTQAAKLSPGIIGILYVFREMKVSEALNTDRGIDEIYKAVGTLWHAATNVPDRTNGNRTVRELAVKAYGRNWRKNAAE
jgi:hypothetical protein